MSVAGSLVSDTWRRRDWVRAICRFAATLIGGIILLPTYGFAQSGLDPEFDRRIDAVQVVIINPSGDSKLNSRIEDKFRSRFAIYPGAMYQKTDVDFAIAIARRKSPTCRTGSTSATPVVSFSSSS